MVGDAKVVDFIPDAKEPTHTTTVTIPRSMSNWIAESGMTYSGAFKRGIAAIQSLRDMELKHAAEVAEVQAMGRRLYQEEHKKAVELQAQLEVLRREVH